MFMQGMASLSSGCETAVHTLGYKLRIYLDTITQMTLDQIQKSLKVIYKSSSVFKMKTVNAHLI